MDDIINYRLVFSNGCTINFKINFSFKKRCYYESGIF